MPQRGWSALLLPPKAGAEWVRGVADPADDLDQPMKGPFRTERGGAADLHALAIRLVKSAHLLPAALVVAVPDAAAVAERHALTYLTIEDLAPVYLATLREVAPHLDGTDWLDEMEREIVARRVPGLSGRLADQMIAAMARIRRLDLKKKPSISETLDWARALIDVPVGPAQDVDEVMAKLLEVAHELKADPERAAQEA